MVRQQQEGGFKSKERANKAESTVLICPTCGMVKAQKHWFWDPEIKESERQEYKEKVCPGCLSIENGWYEGEVVLKNKIAMLVPSQITAMINNLEEAHRHEDPKNRIVHIDKKKTGWIVYTASPYLARIIGDHLGKAYQSKVTYKWSPGNKFVRVIWE
ncbi:MAG: hypothetical protein WC045_00620 [Patescibacteria group bacterium]